MLGTYGVSVQKSIRSSWLAFFKFLRFDVGDGTSVKFWEDVWCRDCSLKEAFPKLYSVSLARESSMLEVKRFSNGRPHWDFQFCCLAQDLEVGSLAWM